MTKIKPVPWQNENSSEEFIPFAVQLDKNTVKTKSGDIVQVIKISGVAHESADFEDISIWKNQINILLRNIASPQIMLWSTTIRRERTVFPAGEFENLFDRELNEKYKAKVTEKSLLINELYISIIYRPHVVKIGSWLSRFEKDREVLKHQQMEAVEAMGEVVALVTSSMSRYNPVRLGTYLRNDILHSQVLEFFDYLVNGSYTPRPLPKKPLSECLARTRTFFGADTFEIRGANYSKFGACLGIIEYPEQTQAGLLNALLSAPFEFVLTQSFQFIAKPIAIEILSRQQKRLESTGDLALSQLDAIDEALDDLVSGRIVYGNHHLTLTVFGKNKRKLKNNLSDALTELADCSMVVAREDWALAAAYWSQLPGVVHLRPRPSPISSKNFAGFSSFHNYPTGQITGNQWGDAVTCFKTSSGSPYYFNFHEPQSSSAFVRTNASFDADERKEAQGEQKALGNTLIIGPSGSGKTVVQGFLMSQSKKYNPTQIVFDKDRGLEIYIRASNGVYLPLENGKPTGFNPFKMEPTAKNILFLQDLIKKICGGTFTAKEEEEISTAVNGVMSLPVELRRLQRCIGFLNPVAEDGVLVRLQKWCETGSLAWVLDNEEDTLSFENNSMFGFDVTEFLDNPEVRTPVIMYLFHRIESLMDGRRFQIYLDEFWKLLLDQFFEDFAQNKQKVIRKQNGIMVYGTQSAKDVLQSPIAHSLIEQCATLIFMPNPKARREDYIEGFCLSEREFQLIKEDLSVGSRSFLIKQGTNSVVAELNLKGFERELSIISGTTDNVKIVEKLIEKHGEKSTEWVEKFHNLRGVI